MDVDKESLQNEALNYCSNKPDTYTWKEQEKKKSTVLCLVIDVPTQ